MRKLHPDGPLWTFWDYKFERWQKDKGMRLDHFLLSPNLSVRLVDGGVDRWARGQENASDHAERRPGSFCWCPSEWHHDEEQETVSQRSDANCGGAEGPMEKVGVQTART
jgi:hypothetical protein